MMRPLCSSNQLRAHVRLRAEIISGSEILGIDYAVYTHVPDVGGVGRVHKFVGVDACHGCGRAEIFGYRARYDII